MKCVLVNPPVLVVDPYQAYAYADVRPYGLYQIATMLAKDGHEVCVVDMMDYRQGDYEGLIDHRFEYSSLPAGDNKSGEKKTVYLYGKTTGWLEEELERIGTADQVLVTCCLPFNFRPAIDVVRLCKRKFPAARVRFGGLYPTLFPEHAARSGADEIFQGRWEQAEKVMGDPSLCDRTPDRWIFKLVNGCKYRCSFCINASTSPSLAFAPRNVANEIARLQREFGIEEFCNWDPNVLLMPDALVELFGWLARAGARPRLRFDMGIAPHLLTQDMARAMYDAGTVAMTIPFESVDPSMMRRFGKPYGEAESLRALEICRNAGFDTRRFHCTFLVGIRGEDLKSVFRTYLAILENGGKPTPFPLTPTPPTREYLRHERWLEGKDLDELNGHLWPTQPADMIGAYDTIMEVLSCMDVRSALKKARKLPERVRELFEQEVRARKALNFGPVPAQAAGGPHPARWTFQYEIPSWLHALCHECTKVAGCSKLSERREADPARCLEQGRMPAPAEVKRLLAWLRNRSGLGRNESLLSLEKNLVVHLRTLGTSQAASFEPSIGWDGKGWSLYRYTYSFHDGMPDSWSSDGKELARWLGMVEPRAQKHGEKVLRLLRPPLGRCLLFGIDYNGNSSKRLKIYFRLSEGMRKGKSALLKALSGKDTGLRSILSAERLFIVGIDLSPRGVGAIKYYFLFDRLENEHMSRWFADTDPYPLLARKLRIRSWEEVILIVRQKGPTIEGNWEIDQVNVHCLKNNIRMRDLVESGFFESTGADATLPMELFGRHPVYLSSMTVPVEGEGVNLYYRLKPSVRNRRLNRRSTRNGR